MNYIVLDLEWNQCPTGKAHEIKALPFEIIEIGAVRVNEAHQVTGQFREIVKPQVYTSLHFRTREIVALRAIDFAGARRFPEVAADFFDWCRGDEASEAAPGEPEFCTWGPADLTEFQWNLSYYNIKSPFPFPLIYFDIQKIFSIVYEDRRSRRSLEYAIDFLEIQKTVAFHSALSDAIYTSLIMQRLEDSQIRDNSSVDYFRTPVSRKEEIYLHYSTYDKFISKLFVSRNQAMKDPVVTSTRCPLCQKAAQKKIRWFSAGGHNQFCLAWCPHHGYIKGKIRLRLNADNMTYAVKTLKPILEEEANQIYEKKQAVKVKRQNHRNTETG
ncbi:MAG: exonuclease domain-containing protein [Lachnospiraceae bacterium]|nr:exonuclease domain-containing protein [Lachnospiraceae bacterium]